MPWPKGVLAAPSPRAYGVEKSRCYVCNPDDPADPDTSYDLGDHWFPANSSRMIVDDTIAHIRNATARDVPFYVNVWFHISHAPMRPTQEQFDAYATFMNGGTLPKKGAASLCNDMPGFIPDYPTCPSLVYRASQFEADAQIGRLLAFLRADPELDSNTLVVFSTGLCLLCGWPACKESIWRMNAESGVSRCTDCVTYAFVCCQAPDSQCSLLPRTRVKIEMAMPCIAGYLYTSSIAK